MSGHRPFSRLRSEVLARRGATERLGRLRAATLDDIDDAQAMTATVVRSTPPSVQHSYNATSAHGRRPEQTNDARWAADGSSEQD